MNAPQLTVKQLFDRESCTYTYLLIDSDTGEGAIIDGVLETFDRDMQIINELGIELLYAIETHAHADHITSAGKIRVGRRSRGFRGSAPVRNALYRKPISWATILLP